MPPYRLNYCLSKENKNVEYFGNVIWRRRKISKYGERKLNKGLQNGFQIYVDVGPREIPGIPKIPLLWRVPGWRVSKFAMLVPVEIPGIPRIPLLWTPGEGAWRKTLGDLVGPCLTHFPVIGISYLVAHVKCYKNHKFILCLLIIE